MYKRILIATDGSPLSHTAIVNGVGMAKTIGAEVVGVHVRPPRSTVYYGDSVIELPAEINERLEEQSVQADERYLSEIAALAKDSGVQYTAAHPRSDTPAEGILETAEALGCDLIVMGSHGRHGLARVLLGSETNKVLTHARIPVLVTH